MYSTGPGALLHIPTPRRSDRTTKDRHIIRLDTPPTPSFQLALVDTRPVAMRWHSKNVDGWSFLGVELVMAPGTTNPVYSTWSCAASGSTETQLIGWR